jgi:hypothetical protein
MVERWRAAGSPEAEARSQFNKKGWGTTIGGILAANSLAGFLANAETAAAELDDTRREFAYLVGVLEDHPQASGAGQNLHRLPCSTVCSRRNSRTCRITPARFAWDCSPDVTLISSS